MDLEVALGCGSRDRYVHQDLRYEKVIIMTDADVDGAHIASLLMTYFLIEMPELVCRGHLYLATPPLYRLSHQQQTVYVRSDAEKEAWMRGKRGGVSVSRFKGLGEMSAEQLRETTMDPSKRSLIRVRVDTDDLVVLQGALEKLMGRHPEWRSEWIQAQSALYYRALETDGWLDV
jgi:topoisomerase-4 subunit B